MSQAIRLRQRRFRRPQAITLLWSLKRFIGILRLRLPRKIVQPIVDRMNRGTRPKECRSFGFRWLGACRHYLQGAKRRVAFLLLFLGAGLMPVQLRAGSPGVFENTGDLTTIQSGHTATLLPNGKVLVTMGSPGTAPASVELYDPATGTWTATSSVSVGNGHAATLLPNGKVLVSGGRIFQNGHPLFLAAASLYDPASGTWTATGSLITARSIHTSTLLPNGKVLVIGGSSNSGTPANEELYDPASGTWTATGSLAAARRGHSATLLLNGMVLVASGLNGNDIPIATAELYDPESGTWATTGSLGTTRRSLSTGTLLPDGKVLFAGGYDDITPLASAEVYDPVSGTFSATGSLSGPRSGYNAKLLPDGKVLVAGGVDNNGPPYHFVANAELFDPANGTWTPTGPLNTPRFAHTLTLLPSGKVLVAGGYDGSNYLRSAELYVGPQTSPAFLNIATRMRVLTDDNVLIGGFIITGTELKRVLIRGIGPSLGLGLLSDPNWNCIKRTIWRQRQRKSNGCNSQQEDMRAQHSANQRFGSASW